MSAFTAKFVERCLSLRSTARVCLTIMTTEMSSQLSALLPGNHPFAETYLSSGVVLKLIDVQEAADRVPVGAHLVGPRTFYMHHGIYLGGGKVAHYSGFSSSFKPGPVEVIDLERFAHGKPVWMYQEQATFPAMKSPTGRAPGSARINTGFSPITASTFAVGAPAAKVTAPRSMPGCTAHVLCSLLFRRWSTTLLPSAG